MNIPYVNLKAQWEDEKKDLIPIIDKVLSSGVYVGGSEIDKFEEEAFHIMGVSSTKNIFAVGRLHMINKHIAQIRYMAVEEEYRKKNVGMLILNELEKKDLYIKDITDKIVKKSLFKIGKFIAFM